MIEKYSHITGELGVHREILPPDSLLVIEQGYLFPPSMRSERCRLYKVVQAGDEIPPPEEFNHPSGYSPTDTVVTFLKPNEWTIATTETFSIDDKGPQQKYAVLNINGQEERYQLNRLLKWKLKRKGFQFVEPGSITHPPYTIVL